MSIPIVAAVLAEHVGQMLTEIERALDHCKVRIEYSQHTTNPFHCWIRDGLTEFHGEDTDAGRALHQANNKRQAWQERRDRARAREIEEAPDDRDIAYVVHGLREEDLP